MDRGQPGFRAQRKRRLGQAEEGCPASVWPADLGWRGTFFYEQWELVRIRQIWDQIRLALQKYSVVTEWRCVVGARLNVWRSEEVQGASSEVPSTSGILSWTGYVAVLLVYSLNISMARLYPQSEFPCQNPQEGAVQVSVSPWGD